MTQLILAILIAATATAVSAEEDAPAEVRTSADRVYIIPIQEMIEPALVYVIQRGLKEAEDFGAKAVIFPMHTPGGTVQAAEEIIRLLDGVDVPTYTFVDKNAISAGAIIAMATDHIYMAPGSKIGDAMPIMMTPFGGVQEMPEGVEEKTVSYVSGIIRAAAQNHGHDDTLAEAMVRREMEYKVDKEVIVKEGQLLTLTNVEAERLVGKEKRPLLSEGTVEDIDDLLERIGLADAQRKEITITDAEKLGRLIAAIAPLLLIAGLLGIYIEVKTPGFGLPGILGGTCLIIFFWGHHVAGLAGNEDIALFVVGLVLLSVEVLFIPGFGFVGMIGLMLMIWGVLGAMIESLPSEPWYPVSWPQVEIPLLKLTISLLGTAAGGVILGKFLPRTHLFQRLVLNAANKGENGFRAAEEHNDLVGQTGEAITPLRPSGRGIFGNQKFDVVTDGRFVESGGKIRITETHGNRIVVEPADDGQEKE
ncbi:MAG: hypothetical protein KJ626_12375 [Verrucomicrobia bacterium]|nr:hypothetical protein [Verrucomicrobiota bacterium]